MPLSIHESPGRQKANGKGKVHDPAITPRMKLNAIVLYGARSYASIKRPIGIFYVFINSFAEGETMSNLLVVPDSAICQRATELVQQLSPDFLFQHCARTYQFGGLLGQKEGMKIDWELFYLGSILHDLGLTHECDHGNSFEIDGADAAEAYLTEHRYPKEKIDIVREAIVLHTTVEAESKRPEIALVHFGTGPDIGRPEIRDLPSDRVQEILEAHPRLGFKKAFAEVMKNDAKRKPDTLSDHLLSSGLEHRIKEALLTE